MKVSLVIPVYYNEDNLRPLYKDIKEKFIENMNGDVFISIKELPKGKDVNDLTKSEFELLKTDDF